MKAIRMLSAIALVMSGWMTSYSQVVEAEVPGDNFSLEGALELFKKSSSPEEFEKLLNSPDSKVNNLDLNGDGYIDYIRVHDRNERNVHAFVIQAVISENELQDVAVIELEKLSNGKAVLQIIGDEAIYGVETIIEPTSEVRTYAGTQSSRTVVNVWAWPTVQYVYSPYYSVWDSPWGWYHRPVWWHSWRPIAYVHYHPIWRPYYHYYAVCHTRRVVYAHQLYHPHRRTSIVVRDRYHDQLVRYRTDYRDDRGRTRYEQRRSYAQDNRSSRERTTVERRAEPVQQNRTPVRRDNTVSRERATNQQQSRDVRTRPSELRRAETPVRKTEADPKTREFQQVASPADVNRSRSVESSRTQQRPTAERTVRTEVRQPSEMRRQSPPSRSGSLEANRPTPARSPAVERRASPSPAPAVQQRTAPRSTPAPSVERRSSERSSEGRSRTGAPQRGRQ